MLGLYNCKHMKDRHQLTQHCNQIKVFTKKSLCKGSLYLPSTTSRTCAVHTITVSPGGSYWMPRLVLIILTVGHGCGLKKYRNCFLCPQKQNAVSLILFFVNLLVLVYRLSDSNRPLTVTAHCMPATPELEISLQERKKENILETKQQFFLKKISNWQYFGSVVEVQIREG